MAAASAPLPHRANDSTTIESVGLGGGRAEASAMHLMRIDHVSLNVHDRPGTLAWYEEVLGVRSRHRHGPDDQPIFLGPAGVRLGFFADREPGLRHIALATTAADQAQLARRLDGLAIPYRPERHGDHDSLYFADPDGTTLEVMVPTTR
jgi:catechol 2,3-dioxygenase-like lactoylglutathione lyase family enzyme